nr:Hypothetical protein CBG16326 [Haemonchus contortus]
MHTASHLLLREKNLISHIRVEKINRSHIKTDSIEMCIRKADVVLIPYVILRPIYLVKHWKDEKAAKDSTINPDTTEAVMKNIRGIPFLIQAIQYSMETTYYRDVLNELGEGVVRTSVIHTAPGCTSVLDSGSDDETEKVKITSRSSAEEQWLPFGESWRNEQLRLSLERGSSNLLVFPYCEASPHGERVQEAVDHDFSRIESIKRPHGRCGRMQTNRQHFQVRCIGMSASFIERFNNSFRTSTLHS